MLVEKTCPRCLLDLPVTAFSRNKNRKDGLQAYCKACSLRANRSTEAKNAARDSVPMPASKTCATCAETKPSDEYFRDARRKDGLYSNCRPCHTLLTTKWKKANPGVEAAIRKRSYDKHAPKRRAYQREWAQRFPERAKARASEWKRKNRAHATALELVRSSRYKAAPGKTTAQLIAAKWEYYGGLCWMCGGVAQETDHVKPLCAGGSNWLSNLRPACARCNRSKNGAWPFPVATYRATRLVR